MEVKEADQVRAHHALDVDFFEALLIIAKKEFYNCYNLFSQRRGICMNSIRCSLVWMCSESYHLFSDAFQTALPRS
jgi:hypothetical protein